MKTIFKRWALAVALLGMVTCGLESVLSAAAAVELPHPPAPYVLPKNAVYVKNAAEFISAFESVEAKDIILYDGSYEHTTFAKAGAPHRIWAEHLGAAQLRFGIAFSGNRLTSGGEVHGIRFEISDANNTENEAAISMWGSAGENVGIFDTTVNGNHAIGHGILSRKPSGLIIERVIIKNTTSNGITLQAFASEMRTYVPEILPQISDIEIHGIYRDVRGSSNGTAEAGLWLGSSGFVDRVLVTDTGWMGIRTGSNCNDSILRNLTIDNVYITDAESEEIWSGNGIYVGHWTRNTVFENFQIGPSTGRPWIKNHMMPRGIVTEWANPKVSPNPIDGESLAASQSNIFRNGRINSTYIGISFEHAVNNIVENVEFVNQSAAAIKDFQGDDQVITLQYLDRNNDFSGIRPDAKTYTNDHRPLGFILQPSGKTVTPGETVTLSAIASSGYIPVAYQWYNKGVPIEGVVNSSYTFVAPNLPGSEVYTVVATNEYESRKSVGVSVKTESQNSCEQIYQIDSPPIVGFAPPFALYSPEQEALLSASCNSETQSLQLTYGSGKDAQYIYHQGYYWNGESWQGFSLQGSRLGTSWISGQASATIPEVAGETRYFIGYVCEYYINEWKCGCTDAACKQQSWQLQGVRQ